MKRKSHVTKFDLALIRATLASCYTPTNDGENYKATFDVFYRYYLQYIERMSPGTKPLAKQQVSSLIRSLGYMINRQSVSIGSCIYGIKELSVKRLFSETVDPLDIVWEPDPYKPISLMPAHRRERLKDHARSMRVKKLEKNIE